MKTELYIGGQAGNGKVTQEHLAKCIKIIKRYHKNFTYEIIKGVWKSKEIETIRITIFQKHELDNYISMSEVLDLKQELKQKKILVAQSQTEHGLV